MGKKILEYIIRAVDGTAAGTRSAIDRAKQMAATIGKNLMNIKAGFEMVTSGIRTVAKAMWSTLKESFKFETLTVQFNTLIGDMDKTKKHMQDLKELGDTPPFSLEAMAAASRTMMVASGGALGFKESMIMVGDAAAATGNDVGGLADAVGRAYAIIRDGQPITRATMQLRNMKIITPELAAKMEELQEAGASNIAIWEELEKALLKHKGAMEKTEGTGQGLIDAIGSQWTNIVRTFGDAMQETSKEGLGGLLEKLKELNEDGTIEVWAERADKALKTMLKSVRAVGTGLAKLYQWSGASDIVALSKGIGSFARTLAGGGSTKDALIAMVREGAKGFYQGKLHSLTGDKFGGVAAHKAELEEQAKAEDEIRRKAVAKKQAAQKEAAKVEADDRAKLIADMAAAQAKQDAKRLAEEEAKRLEMLAEEEAKRLEMLAEEDEKRWKMLEKEAKEQAELEHKLKIKNLQAEAKESYNLQKEASDRVSRARAASQQAWGWYRDPKSFGAQLREEKAEKKAQKKFEKDFARMRRRYGEGWRTNERMSARHEVVKRVALAREEEKRAEQALIKIEENTANLESMLENLLTMQ